MKFKKRKINLPLLAILKLRQDDLRFFNSLPQQVNVRSSVSAKAIAEQSENYGEIVIDQCFTRVCRKTNIYTKVWRNRLKILLFSSVLSTAND